MGISFESSSTSAGSSPQTSTRSKARWADLSDEVEEQLWPESSLDYLKVTPQAQEDALDAATDSKSLGSLQSSDEVPSQQGTEEALPTLKVQDWQAGKPDRPKTLLSSTYRAKGRGLRWAAKVVESSKGALGEAPSKSASRQYPSQYYDRYYDQNLGYYGDAYYYTKGNRWKSWKDYEPAAYAGVFEDDGFNYGSTFKGKGMRQQERCKKQCQFIIGIEEDPIFRVGRRLLGPNGSHMKSIAAKTGCRLRLRGKGSWFLEGPNQEESSDPLMLCVSSPSETAHAKAVQLIEELLLSVYADFRDFCKKEGWPVRELKIRRNEGARKGAR